MKYPTKGQYKRVPNKRHVRRTKRGKREQRSIKLKHKPPLFLRLIQRIPQIVIPFPRLLLQFLVRLDNNIGAIDICRKVLGLSHSVSIVQESDMHTVGSRRYLGL
jgi:hypothetical protein